MGILSDILRRKQAELPELRLRSLPQPPALAPLKLERTKGQPLHLITEIKLRSPSAGPLSHALSVAERAAAYERAGASMISVLCDETFFDGGFHHLAQARAACDLPLLCKEFVIDEIQLDAARAYGASAVLLIARCLEEQVLRRLISASKQRDLIPLVEVFTEDEARLALACGARHIGVNARDLDTLQMDETRAQTVARNLPRNVVRAHFSGIKDTDSLGRAIRSGVDAALVGEILMRQDDPEPLLRSFVQTAAALVA